MSTVNPGLPLPPVSTLPLLQQYKGRKERLAPLLSAIFHSLQSVRFASRVVFKATIYFLKELFIAPWRWGTLSLLLLRPMLCIMGLAFFLLLRGPVLLMEAIRKFFLASEQCEVLFEMVEKNSYWTLFYSLFLYYYASRSSEKSHRLHDMRIAVATVRAEVMRLFFSPTSYWQKLMEFDGKLDGWIGITTIGEDIRMARACFQLAGSLGAHEVFV